MSIKLEVWGDYALFTRPEMKVERVSYDVMTPSAARGLIEAIYWHPGMRWHIDRIHVCAPIRFTNLRRNEVKSTISARTARTVMERGKGELCLSTSEDIQQRAALLLREVRYVIEAHFEMTEQAAPGDHQHKNRVPMLKAEVHTTYCLASSASPPISSAITALAEATGEPYMPTRALSTAGVTVKTPSAWARKAIPKPTAGASTSRWITPTASSFFMSPTALKFTRAPSRIRISGEAISARLSMAE